MTYSFLVETKDKEKVTKPIEVNTCLYFTVINLIKNEITFYLFNNSGLNLCPTTLNQIGMKKKM